MNWKLILSYDGTTFHGWQVQPGLPTVQGALAAAIEQVTGETVLPQGSGRTDSGVHALMQVASFSLEAPVPAANLLRALNHVLPASVRVLAATEVDRSFHARHSAQGKLYEYRIFERRTRSATGEASLERICSPFLAPYVWDCRWSLEFEAMQQGAAALAGTHDFTSFAASDPDKALRDEDGAAELDETGRSTKVNPVKTIQSSVWTRENDLLIYRVQGSGFLHHMVRNIVGTLVDIGRGSLLASDIPAILDAQDRTRAGPTAPARGLFLHTVEYDPRYNDDACPVGIDDPGSAQ
jgi:tRNA pseudouridine38-40 synthase